ncbi:MAG TPA: zf-HC2 domain-containing protein [Actinomycetota bacterium]|nr:zf-HC2 domain-containing protein [Actinomycetota bacterium]
MTEELECAEARELIPELAASVAAGDERARALGHLSGCAECRRELAGTAEVVDELLLLAPEREPPAGFERAVMARLTPAAPRRRLRARLLWAASIVAVAGLAAGAAWWGTTDDRELASSFRHTLEVAHGHGLSAAPLRLAGGAETGTVFAYQGEPSWVYVTFRSAPPQGHYDVRLLTRDGRRLALRPFTATPAGTAWGSTIQVPIQQIQKIEFIRSDVPVLTASFG